MNKAKNSNRQINNNKKEKSKKEWVKKIFPSNQAPINVAQTYKAATATTTSTNHSEFKAALKPKRVPLSAAAATTATSNSNRRNKSSAMFNFAQFFFFFIAAFTLTFLVFSFDLTNLFNEAQNGRFVQNFKEQYTLLAERTFKWLSNMNLSSLKASSFNEYLTMASKYSMSSTRFLYENMLKISSDLQLRLSVLLKHVEENSPFYYERTMNAINQTRTVADAYLHQVADYFKNEVFVGEMSPANITKSAKQMYENFYNKIFT